MKLPPERAEQPTIDAQTRRAALDLMTPDEVNVHGFAFVDSRGGAIPDRDSPVSLRACGCIETASAAQS